MVDVLVVGAGPTGLMLACEALRHGLSVRVVDRAPAPSPLSRAIVLQARTLEILETHGLTPALVEAGNPLRQVHFTAGGRQVSVSFDHLPTRYAYLLCLPQSATERILHDRLVALGGRVDRGVGLHALRADVDGVTAVLDDGEQRCAWLVGCDGAHSEVRKQLGLTFSGHAYEERLALGDVRWDAPVPTDALSSFLGDGFLAAFPLPDGRVRLIATVDDDRDDELSLRELAAICEARTPWGGRLSDPGWLARFRIHARQVDRYRVGRVLLAGDAAHIHSPAGGQGMNLGIQDAHNLAWKLAMMQRGAPEALLDSYHAERHPLAARTLRATDLATRLGTVRHPWLRALRDLAGSAVGGLSPVVDAITRSVAELDTGVEHSPIVVDDAPGGPHAGHRPPDLPVSTRHVLMQIAGPSTDADGRLRLRACVGVARDGWGDRVQLAPTTAREGFDADGIFLVRPDGYVGVRLAPADPGRLAAALARAVGPPLPE